MHGSPPVPRHSLLPFLDDEPPGICEGVGHGCPQVGRVMGGISALPPRSLGKSHKNTVLLILQPLGTLSVNQFASQISLLV